MSMMKPDANQTTSMGMMEIIGARTGRLRESNALSVSVPSTRCGSISPAYRLNKKTLAVVVVGLTRRKSGRPHQGRGGIRTETGDATAAHGAGTPLPIEPSI
jgi:hypothetical protein